MTQWRYSAETADRQIADGVIEASSVDGAARALFAKGLKPINVAPLRSRSIRSLTGHRRTLSLSDTAAFSGALADLLASGLPVAKALNLVAGQSSRVNVSALAGRLADRLKTGAPLSKALEQDDVNIPPLMTALIVTGEALGDLPAQLSRLSQLYASAVSLRREIVGQLLYPAALFIMILLTLIFLSVFVLPQFETVFAGAGAPPPPETRFVINAGAFIRRWWLWLFGAMVVGGLFLRWLSARHQEAVDRFFAAMPAAGSFLLTLNASRYCRSLGALLAGGAPLVDAMPIARGAVDNSAVAKSLLNMEDNVRRGERVSTAATAHRALPDDILVFVSLGEETGELAAMTSKAADMAEERISSTLKRIAALSGPIMTAIMGLLTAGVIAGVMSGVMSLNDAVYQ